MPRTDLDDTLQFRTPKAIIEENENLEKKREFKRIQITHENAWIGMTVYTSPRRGYPAFNLEEIREDCIVVRCVAGHESHVGQLTEHSREKEWWVPYHLPTPSEIYQECRRIQSFWPDSEEVKRREHHPVIVGGGLLSTSREITGM